MKVSAQPGDTVVTHALGSCLGISAHDPESLVGGIIHVMLPSGRVNQERARNKPLMFVDTGVPMFFKELYSLGAVKQRLVVKVAGGAAMKETEDFFAIGKRNLVMLRKLLSRNRVVISSQDIGGSISRTMYLDVRSGRVWVCSAGKEWDL